MGTIPLAITARTTRSSMLEVLKQDYVKTARAAGVPERRVIYRYALRNALLPVITVGGLLGGLRGLSPREISSGLYSAHRPSTVSLGLNPHNGRFVA